MVRELALYLTVFDLPQNMPTVRFGFQLHLVLTFPTLSLFSFSFIFDALKIHFNEVSEIFLCLSLILVCFCKKYVYDKTKPERLAAVEGLLYNNITSL